MSRYIAMGCALIALLIGSNQSLLLDNFGPGYQVLLIGLIGGAFLATFVGLTFNAIINVWYRG